MRLISLIGRCGNETVKKTLKEESYKSYDFDYLRRWILKNFRNKISASEGKNFKDNEIDISFSFIDKDGKQKKIYLLSKKIFKYYSKCEGRIYWSYKLPKYEVPKLISGYDNSFFRENNFSDRGQLNTNNLTDLSDNKLGDNLYKPFDWDSNLTSKNHSKKRSYNSDLSDYKRFDPSTYSKSSKSIHRKSLPQRDTIAKANPQKPSKVISSTANKKPVHISPPPYSPVTISTPYIPTGPLYSWRERMEGLVQMITASFQLIWMFIVIVVGLGIMIVAIYIFIKNMVKIWL